MTREKARLEIDSKDCKHNDEGTCYIDGLDDYFCSSAERRK